ncbi:MAG: hypothetical protein ACI9D0_002071 [Bacteroidia bacterium]|jgi:hypothetical protein
MKNKTTHFSLAALAVSATLISLSFAEHEKEGTAEFWSYPSSEANPAANDILAQAALTPGAIDLAICLDTSGSMDGLIESAKQRLWALVNDLAKAEPAPKLRVALLTYGSPDYGADNGWVKTVLPLTTDLDMVSMQLFALQTNGGDEYVARVADAAAKQLSWSEQPGALKMVVVAGNESAEQDPVLTLKQAVGGAAEQGIIVHSLYCRQGGAPQGLARNATPVQTTGAGQLAAVQGQGGINSLVVNAVGPVAMSTPPVVVPLDEIARGWKKVATLAGGAFAVIDQDSGIIVMETPFDESLVKLSTDINETYIAYGENSRWNVSNQAAQDANAVNMNLENAASRAMTKGGKLYMCSWDLIDALGTGQLEIGKIDSNLLAEELRLLSADALTKLIDSKRADRTRIQGEIAALGLKREAFLSMKRAELSADESEAFDSVLRKAFRDKATAKGFKFPAPAKAAKLEMEPAEAVPAEVIFDVTLGDVLEGC